MDEETMERMKAAALRFRSGESDLEEIETPTGLVRLVRDPALPGGHRVEIENRDDGKTISMAIQSFGPSPERPEGYPADVPFVPDCHASINHTARSATWVNPPDAGAAFDAVVTACVEDGWRQVELHPVIADSDGVRQAELRRPGRERFVMLRTHGEMASLMMGEKESRDASPEDGVSESGDRDVPGDGG